MALNNKGQVVGAAGRFPGPGGDPHAFVWDAQNGIWDLNLLIDDPTWVLVAAQGINDAGQIVGVGYHNGYMRGFRLNPTASVTIGRVQMFGPHTLGVEVTAAVPSSTTGNGIVGISVAFKDENAKGDRVLDSSNRGDQCTWTIPATESGTACHLFRIDLSDPRYVIPRFADNQRLTVDAQASFPDGSSSTASAAAAIVLPVVVIPGINPTSLSDTGGDGKFPALEAYFQDNTRSSFWTGYELRGSGSSYPTLFTLSYDVNYATFDDGAVALFNLMNQIWSSTYADKVNLVGHSKGGLVARWLLQAPGNAAGSVNQLIMCVTPNTGSAYAALAKLYSNLWPTWPWTRTWPDEQFKAAPVNAVLNRLNCMAKSGNLSKLPIGPKYSIFYSVNPLLLTTVAYMRFGSDWYDGGDGIVPWFSQMGLQHDENQPDASLGPVEAFSGIWSTINWVELDYAHTGYPDRPEVSKALLQLLTAGLPAPGGGSW